MNAFCIRKWRMKSTKLKRAMVKYLREADLAIDAAVALRPTLVRVLLDLEHIVQRDTEKSRT